MLSSVLFHSILDRSAPLSTNAIKSLRKSPMDLDVYAWLVHRLYHLSKPSTVTWQQLSEQFGHGYSELRLFRRFFVGSLKRVHVVYPEAKLKVADAGVILMPSRPHTARALTEAERYIVTPITCAIRARIANLSVRAFASARIRPEEGTLHLSRPIAQPTVFKCILTNWRGQGRAPTRYICPAQPLHLSRPGVASVTQKRCISPAKVPFSLVKSSTSRPLLYSPVLPVVILGSKAASKPGARSRRTDEEGTQEETRRTRTQSRPAIRTRAAFHRSTQGHSRRQPT